MPVDEIRDVAGFPTHVTQIGAGSRAALFIHCTLGTDAAWSGVQGQLLDDLAMTGFDRPSHGSSGTWDGAGGAAALHDLTTAMAEGLLGQSADVIGHSFGATVALRLALEQPDRVRSLTLIEPVLIFAAAGTAEHDCHAAEMARFLDVFASGDRAGAAEIFQTLVAPDTPWATLSDRAKARAAAAIHLIADEASVTLDDEVGVFAPGRIEALAMPVLLIEGTASPRAIGPVHAALSARIPQAQRVIIGGAGHMSPITHPAAVATELRAFLGL